MLSKIYAALLVPFLLLSSTVEASPGALVDKSAVGALTPLSSKSKICNVLNYGAVADGTTDLGPAIRAAFAQCALGGGATIYIPPGSYSRESFHPNWSSKCSRVHSCYW